MPALTGTCPCGGQRFIPPRGLYLVFLSPDYLNDLQGRSDEDSNGSWEFYGSSVCGEQLSFFVQWQVNELQNISLWCG